MVEITLKKPSMAGRTLLQAAAWGLASIGVAWVISSLYGIYRSGWTTLTMDQWRIYTDYFSRDFPENILVLQNGHPSIFPGLVRLADVYFADANNHVLLFCAAVLTVCAACLMSWIIWRERAQSRSFRLLCIAPVWLLLFWLANIRVLGHDPGVAYSLTVLSFTAAVWALIRAGEALVQERPGRAAAALAGAVLGCFAATFSMGFGLVTWPAIIVAAVVLRLPRKHLGLLGALFAGVLVLYVFILPGSQETGSLLGAGPLDILVHAGTWLGAPLYHIAQGFGLEDASLQINVLSPIVGGGALLAAALIFLRTFFRARPVTSLEAWGLAVTAFGVGCALLVALGRDAHAALSPNVWVAPRYLPWVCFFWAGFLVLLGVHAQRRRRGLARGAWVGLVCLLPVLLYPSHRANYLHHEYAKLRIEDAALGVVVGVHDDERVRRFLFRNPQVVYRLAGALQARRLSMYTWEASRHMGARVDQAFDVAPSSAARGQVLGITAFPDVDTVGARIEGWAVDGRGRPPRYVVVADRAGHIRGLARFTRSRKGVAERLHLDPDARLFFSGYIKDYDARAPYTYFAVLQDGRVAVRLTNTAPPHR